MVRKFLSILFLIGFITIHLNGQEKFKKEWNIGAGFGATFSSVDFFPGVATKNEMQYMGGIAARYISENHLGIIAEVNYSQQGWSASFENNPEYAHTHTLNYIEIPVLTHIYFGNKARFFINLGPKISYLIGENETINQELANYLASGNLLPSMPTAQYFRKADKSIEYGIMAGLGMEFRTGIGNFSLEGRYYYGLSDVYNNSKSDYFGRSANRVISAKLTYYVKIF